MPLTDDEKRKVGRAIWSYTGKDQREFAGDAGLSYDRLRGMLNDPKKSAPSTDELLAMASAARVPRAFALDGWIVADPFARLEQRISRIELALSAPRAASATPAPPDPLGRELRGDPPSRQDQPQSGSQRGQDATSGNAE